MSKVAIVYWSGTGNTKEMVDSLEESLNGLGAEATVFDAADFNADMVADYDAFAFGCPAMGDEILEEDEFEPMWQDCLPNLSGKKIALFGSYDWGDGEWMRNWSDDASDAGADLVAEGLICHLEPDDDCKAKLKEIAGKLV